MQNENLHIGQVIRMLRREKKYSQEALAEGICSRRYLIELEKGKYTPTTFIIEQISKKLHVDIARQYAIVQKHKNIETHIHINHLDELLTPNTLEKLYKYILKCNQLEEFQSGEPRQHLLYASSIYEANVRKDYNQALAYAVEGIKLMHPEFALDKKLRNVYSNIELNLINCIAANKLRLEDDIAMDIYIHLAEYLYPFTKDNRYIIYMNTHFEIVLYIATICNLAEICIKEQKYEQSLESIDYAIELLQRVSYSNFLFQLVKNKCIIHYKLGHYEEAQKVYNHAKVLCLYSNTTNETPESLETFAREQLPLLKND